MGVGGGGGWRNLSKESVRQKTGGNDEEGIMKKNTKEQERKTERQKDRKTHILPSETMVCLHTLIP